jgi:hypothetical protein
MATTKTPRLSAEQSQLLTRLLTIAKTANMKAVMDASELARLIAIVVTDIGKAVEFQKTFPTHWPNIAPPSDYYSVPVDWFAEEDKSITIFDVVDMLEVGRSLDDDFHTYLRCLAELHKRRRKYGLILQRQPLPTMVQVSPRALMEYGPDFPPEALASWLSWRKFFYDLDNRSAQETGYLFEPILAAAIGGEPKSAKTRVVRRSDDASKGRQVDCWKVRADGIPLAYELKLRVTIAASGQGRFGEELSFALDCKNSGAKPILVVLDPTENEKLTDLQAAYLAEGGEAFIGPAAWQHLEDEAGPTMAEFIDRYVRTPVAAVTTFEMMVNDDPNHRIHKLLDLAASVAGNNLTISLGTHNRIIERHEDPSLAEDGDDEDGA